MDRQPVKRSVALRLLRAKRGAGPNVYTPRRKTAVLSAGRSEPTGTTNVIPVRIVEKPADFAAADYFVDVYE
jgi:hypothetical protein